MFYDVTQELLLLISEKPLKYEDLFQKVRAQRPNCGADFKKSFNYCLKEAINSGIVAEIRGIFCILELDGVTPIGVDFPPEKVDIESVGMKRRRHDSGEGSFLAEGARRLSLLPPYLASPDAKQPQTCEKTQEGEQFKEVNKYLAKKYNQY